MKILHTADWHLGQKFKQHLDRIEEHQRAINGLLELIRTEKVDVLLVAGDVFDTPNPPNNARQLYYQFLVDAGRAGCRHIVVTGGNHDSPYMLNAPKEVLAAINAHVVGCATEDIQDEIIPLYDDDGVLEAVVAAVPFLRDRDLKSAVSGEGGEHRVQRIQEGIKAHYEAAAAAVMEYVGLGVPILTMGHLYAKGAQASDRQDNIYIGDMENITASAFPGVFDYVALGHIHKEQMVGKQEHIRYSGSLIPMSFGEWKDDKSVTLVEMKGREIQGIRIIPVPLGRKLVSLKGEEQEVEEELKGIIHDMQGKGGDMEAWVEILIQGTASRPDIYPYFSEMVQEAPVRILRVSYAHSYKSVDALSTEYELDDLRPLDIFKKRCEAAMMAEKESQEMEEAFRELLSWMEDRE